MRKEVLDISTGSIILLLSILGFMIADSFGSNQSYGPDFFPKLISVLLGVSALILLIGGIRRLQTADKAQIKFEKKLIGRIALFVALLVAYISLFFVTGFIVSTILFLVVAQWIFGVRKIVVLASVSIVIPILLYIIFTLAFKIPLP